MGVAREMMLLTDYDNRPQVFTAIHRRLMLCLNLGGQRLTPEGFLLCEGVAIARTGEQVYHKSELALEPGADGNITVSRIADEVFDPTSMASFEGKPVTMDHPAGFVNPTNYRQLEVGTVHNVRRGGGIQDDMLLADLLIKDAAAIEFVNKRRPEISCGYNSEYD